ncbi:cupredoxin domain-containing protein [Demequina subtropica]|uniref:cupredoxin domain-containing protein n=1 Tax=Demequina subtropica TaxID=1638989 RepID=UPI000782F352|nr:cupredoxin domain-containing protein [Demequina subtropica]
MRLSPSRPVTAIAVLTLVGALSACGGDADAPSVSSPETNATVVDVSATEYAFAASATDVPAGPVELVLTNDGAMGHDLVLEGDPGGATAVIEPGETDSFEVTLEPGTYTLYCSVGDHRTRGMEIEITAS